METKFDFSGKYLFLPIAFREDFNNFARLSATQAWSLFFTASQDDTALGNNKQIGRLWTIFLISSVVASIIEVLLTHQF